MVEFNLHKLKFWSDKDTLFSAINAKASFNCQSDNSRSHIVKKKVEEV